MIHILLSSPAEASLHLVSNHQHVVLGAQLAHLGQVSFVGDHHACLTLDRLKHEATHVGVLKLFLHTHTHTHSTVNQNWKWTQHQCIQDILYMHTQLEISLQLVQRPQLKDKKHSDVFIWLNSFSKNYFGLGIFKWTVTTHTHTHTQIYGCPGKVQACWVIDEKNNLFSKWKIKTTVHWSKIQPFKFDHFYLSDNLCLVKASWLI